MKNETITITAYYSLISTSVAKPVSKYPSIQYLSHHAQCIPRDM